MFYEYFQENKELANTSKGIKIIFLNNSINTPTAITSDNATVSRLFEMTNNFKNIFQIFRCPILHQIFQEKVL